MFGLLTLLADGDPSAFPLKSLTENWPWLTVLIGFASWFGKYVLIPLTQRHTSFIDALENRERQRLENDITMGAALAGISDKLSDHSGKLSDIKELSGASKCEARVFMRGGAPPLQPQGGV